MDAITQAIADVIRFLFTRPENIALFVSFTANVGMAIFIYLMRKEDRVDRQAFIATLTGLTSALVELRVAFAASGIRSR